MVFLRYCLKKVSLDELIELKHKGETRRKGYIEINYLYNQHKIFCCGFQEKYLSNLNDLILEKYKNKNFL